jgi:GT2 family glycosyltransferase
MISIVTAVHNQLAMNRLFIEQLYKKTRGPFELIIIDNASSDGSAEFFKVAGAQLIHNPQNLIYPMAQNQGLAASKTDYIAFLNNDVLVSVDWDVRLMELLQRKKLDLLSVASNDRATTSSGTRNLIKRWKRIRYLSYALGQSEKAHKVRVKWMYGNFDQFCGNWYHAELPELVPGFSGHSIFSSRRAMELLGGWDETVLAADFDLYMRSVARYEQFGDIQPLKLAGRVFFHHFGRQTLRHCQQPWEAPHPLRSLEQKWGDEKVQQTMATLKQFDLK